MAFWDRVVFNLEDRRYYHRGQHRLCNRQHSNLQTYRPAWMELYCADIQRSKCSTSNRRTNIPKRCFLTPHISSHIHVLLRLQLKMLDLDFLHHYMRKHLQMETLSAGSMVDEQGSIAKQRNCRRGTGASRTFI